MNLWSANSLSFRCCIQCIDFALQKNVQCMEIDLVKDNVTSDDVFILDLGLKLFQVRYLL